jgi:hypothetical protein
MKSPVWFFQVILKKIMGAMGLIGVLQKIIISASQAFPSGAFTTQP